MSYVTAERNPLEPESLKQFKASLVVIVFVLVAGSLGFYLLGNSRSLFECFYLTMMIVTTLGLKEQFPRFNEAESIWSLLVMMVGILTALYAASNLTAFFAGGEMKRVLGRRQLQSNIDRLENHFIVCGFGRMGRALCDALSAKRVPFVVIDLNPDRTAMADQRDFLYILADATMEATLSMARIDQARGLATCLKSDADNVLVTLSARGMNEGIPIIARAEQVETKRKLERAGASRVICPPVHGANRIMQLMLHPAVEELVDLAVSGQDLEISKFNASELPQAISKTLSDLQLPSRTGLMVVAVVHPDGTRRLNPPPNFRIGPDDELIVIGPMGGVDLLFGALGQSRKS